jgi:GNAT superfamily N-acetyltransferase
MYSIISLDPAAALRFKALAPFEVREILRGLSSLPRVRAFGATLMGHPVGLVVTARDSDRLAGAATSDTPGSTARLLALTVGKRFRRIGIGRALLAGASRALQDDGVRQLSCAYAFDTAEGTQTAEAFFAAAGWDTPETTMVHCQADESFMDAPLLRDLPPLPDEYEICDWIDLTPAERESIAERQRRDPWYPPSLDPFHFEAELEVINSLALRYHGEVVGWLLTHRTSPRTMYYRCLFVRDDLARLGRGLSLLVEAIRRHWDAIGHQSGLGEWSTPSSLPRMIRFIRRHLAPFGAAVREQRRTRISLPAPATAATPGSTPSPDGGNASAGPAVVRHVPLLSTDEAARVRALVMDARTDWREHRESLPFHTFGACARLDALDDVREYQRRAARDNALLRDRFAWLYARVLDTLAVALGAPAAYAEACALPGFRIAHAQRGATLPLAPIHCDVLHYTLAPGARAALRAVSFALCVTPPEHHSGVTLWTLAHDDTIGLDSEETARLLDAAPRQRHTFESGAMLLRPANVYHQRLPIHDPVPREPVITLEGHAFLADDTWRVYW